jgi:CDP-2,3-bis-(O-geranylgeranyl)-sn-glycerol synthase
MASVTRRISFLKFLAVPLDFGKKINGHIILGSSKTWRGFFTGPFFGFLIVFLQLYLYRYDFFQVISLVNYQEINIFLFASLMCFGAMFGDALFSFFKRRRNFKTGAPWIPIDQWDFVIGAFIFLTPYLNFTLGLDFGVSHWVTIMAIALILHAIANNIGYYLGFQKNRW